ncbi:glycosyltransferase family 2 protein [bacterium]|nr:glycosyltransferase family 2 protein [bacterium]
MPLISVGVPVYNGEGFLGQSLDSILAQTYEDFEVIISDNASSDYTEDICRVFAGKDARIRYFRNPNNIGAARNFNRVFELAHGEYFRWHSADDLCEPTLLEKCKATLEEHSDAVLCAPKTCLIDEKGSIICRRDNELDLRHSQAHARFLALNVTLGLCNAQYGLMRTAAVRRTALEGDYPGSDMVFLSELSLHGQFIQIPEYLFFRRLHSHAASSLVSVEAQQEFWDPLNKDKLFLRTWRHLYENLRGIRRAPLGFAEEARVLREWLKLVRWHRHDLLAELQLWMRTQFGAPLDMIETER